MLSLWRGTPPYMYKWIRSFLHFPEAFSYITNICVWHICKDDGYEDNQLKCVKPICARACVLVESLTSVLHISHANCIPNILLPQGRGHLTSDPCMWTLTLQDRTINFRPTNTCLFLTVNNTQRKGGCFGLSHYTQTAQSADLLILSAGKVWTVASVWVLISGELGNGKQTRIRLISTGCCLVIRNLVCMFRTFWAD